MKELCKQYQNIQVVSSKRQPYVLFQLESIQTFKAPNVLWWRRASNELSNSVLFKREHCSGELFIQNLLKISMPKNKENTGKEKKVISPAI